MRERSENHTARSGCATKTNPSLTFSAGSEACATGDDLKPFAKIFKNDIPDEPGNAGHQKIGGGENIFYGKNQGLTPFVGSSELSHQKV
jgi:hypothetical protein